MLLPLIIWSFADAIAIDYLIIYSLTKCFAIFLKDKRYFGISYDCNNELGLNLTIVANKANGVANMTNELDELVVAKGRDELDKLVVVKGSDELNQFFAAKGRDELDELVVAKGHD